MGGVIAGAWDDGTPRDIRYDLDLGDDHWLCWTTTYDQYEYVAHGDTPAEAKRYTRQFGNLVRTGFIIWHKARTETGWCAAGGRFAWSAWERDHMDQVTGKAIWDFDGNFDVPTFSPSFLCSCGDHGFVRAGRWVRT